MKRLAVHVLVLWLGLGLVMSTYMALVRREPLSGFARVFLTNPDGSLCRRPCLLGIRPGFTAFDDGVALIRAHPMSRYFVMPMERRMTGWPGRSYNLVLGRYDSSERPSPVVTSVFVDFSDYAPRNDPTLHVTVGEVISFLGLPYAMYTRGQLAWLYYPAHRLIITVKLSSRDTKQIDATDPVIAVLLPDEFSYGELVDRFNR
jgi:hypothetical protein